MFIRTGAIDLLLTVTTGQIPYSCLLIPKHFSEQIEKNTREQKWRRGGRFLDLLARTGRSKVGMFICEG
jgi:hypothetical protein